MQWCGFLCSVNSGSAWVYTACFGGCGDIPVFCFKTIFNTENDGMFVFHTIVLNLSKWHFKWKHTAVCLSAKCTMYCMNSALGRAKVLEKLVVSKNGASYTLPSS